MTTYEEAIGNAVRLLADAEPLAINVERRRMLADGWVVVAGELRQREEVLARMEEENEF